MIFKRNVLLIISVLFSMSALAAGNGKPTDWSTVINAIIHVESRGNTNAKSGIYAGAMQIAPIVVKECNLILQEKNSNVRYTLADRFNLKKSKEMFRLYQEKYNPTNDVESAIRLWNGGPKFTIKATDGYFNKVISAMKGN